MAAIPPAQCLAFISAQASLLLEGTKDGSAMERPFSVSPRVSFDGQKIKSRPFILETRGANDDGLMDANMATCLRGASFCFLMVSSCNKQPRMRPSAEVEAGVLNFLALIADDFLMGEAFVVLQVFMVEKQKTSRERLKRKARKDFDGRTFYENSCNSGFESNDPRSVRFGFGFVSFRMAR